MKETQVLPTDFVLPVEIESELRGSERIIYGRPFKKIQTKLSLYKRSFLEEEKSPVSIWVEEGKSDPFLHLLYKLNLLHLPRKP